MVSEEDIRKKVKSLKRFYMDSFTFAIVNVSLIFVWIIVDKSTIFWPKYVMLVWGLALAFKAYRMGLFPLFFYHLSFLTEEWEEQKIKELMGHDHLQRKIQLNRDRKKKLF